jgi:hypothetical protein
MSVNRRLVLTVVLGFSACVRAGYDGRALGTATDSAAADQSIDAPRARGVDAPRDRGVDVTDLPPAVDGVITDLDWARCGDPSNWTCKQTSTTRCDADCQGAFWTWCTGTVCGCGGLGQPLSYALKSTTDCATCLASGPGCVSYYAGLP